jgi:hypothetical protein
MLPLLQMDIHQIDQSGDSSSKGSKKAKQDTHEPRFELTSTQYAAPFMINSIGEHTSCQPPLQAITAIAHCHSSTERSHVPYYMNGQPGVNLVPDTGGRVELVG